MQSAIELAGGVFDKVAGLAERISFAAAVAAVASFPIAGERMRRTNLRRLEKLEEQQRLEEEKRRREAEQRRVEEKQGAFPRSCSAV